MRRLALAFIVAAFACSEPPKQEDPPTEVGDPCGEEESCDKGFACVTLGDATDGTCQALPDGCEDCGDCDTGSLCSADSAGSACISVFSRVTVSCADGGGEGEGEGEGE